MQDPLGKSGYFRVEDLGIESQVAFVAYIPL